MELLDSTRSLQVVLASAITTNQLQWSASYVEITAGALGALGSTDGVTNNTTPVSMIAAPASGTTRQIKELTIYNADTVNATVLVQMVSGANTRTLCKASLIAGQTLTWMPATGWGVTAFTSSGVSLSAVNVWTKNNSVTPVVNSTATGTVTPDASASNNFDYLQTGNLTIANPTNLTAGMVLNFRLKQDATGGRTIAFGSKFKWPGGTVPTWITTANAINFFSAYYDSASDLLLCNGGAGYA